MAGIDPYVAPFEGVMEHGPAWEKTTTGSAETNFNDGWTRTDTRFLGVAHGLAVSTTQM
jgi:hypothetical protein